MTANHLFMTGATGGLGREVLPRVVRDFPAWRVTLLIRGRDQHHVAERLEEIRRYAEFYWPAVDLSRVRAVAGDVSQQQMGLRSGVYERLRRDVTHIIHGAASIKLGLPEECAREINVTGTGEVLSLAERSPRLKHFAHVSTAFIAGDRNGPIRENELACGQGFLNRYERTKFEAEALVRSYMRHLPITVFRPSIIVGNSTDGHTTFFSTLYCPLRRIVAGAIRDIPGEDSTPLDLVPVDVVAEAIAGLVDDPLSRSRTYHLTAGRDNVVTVRWFLESSIRLWGGRSGRELRFIGRSSERPVRIALQQTRQGSASGSAARMLESYFAYLRGRKEFDDTALRRDLPTLHRPHPREYLRNLLRFCKETRWGRCMPWNQAPYPTGGLS
jgi:long-chain acyl-CoA synthetase